MRWREVTYIVKVNVLAVDKHLHRRGVAAVATADQSDGLEGDGAREGHIQDELVVGIALDKQFLCQSALPGLEAAGDRLGRAVESAHLWRVDVLKEGRLVASLPAVVVVVILPVVVSMSVSVSVSVVVALHSCIFKVLGKKGQRTQDMIE